MTKGEVIKSIRNRLFGERDTINEAYHYALDVAASTKDPKAVMNAVHVIMNTIANKLEGNREIKG
jgi:hypothetical protein